MPVLVSNTRSLAVSTAFSDISLSSAFTKKISFQKNAVIHSVYVCIGVVMANQIVDSLFHFIINFHILEEIFYQLRTFFFLVEPFVLPYFTRHTGQAMSWITAAISRISCFLSVKFSISPIILAYVYTFRKWAISCLFPIGICDHFCDNIIYGLLCFCHVFPPSFAFKKQQKSSEGSFQSDYFICKWVTKSQLPGMERSSFEAVILINSAFPYSFFSLLLLIFKHAPERV